ncbi:MAG: RepB family plasmid replication initiator protein [Thiolinea sp.]
MSPNKKTVVISNALNRAAHRLKLSEKRVVMLAASELNHSSDKNPSVTLKIPDLAEHYQLDSKNMYRELKKACKSMTRKPPISIQMEGFLREINWVEYCDYYDNEGRIIIQFTSKIAPHLSALESHFTSYRLSRAGALRSTYAWRLFELLMQFKKTGFLKISTDEFSRAMEVPATYHKDFGAMRRRIIEPAVKEITEKDGLKIKWDAIKTGRKVTALEFYFPIEQQAALPLDKPKTSKTKIDKAYIEQHAQPGETYEQARRRLQEEQKRLKAA